MPSGPSNEISMKRSETTKKENGSDLSGLPNIGKVTERWLQKIGVRTEADLRRLGAVRAYRMIRAGEPAATLNLLYALHGALSGKYWNDLAPAIRETLRKQAEREERG